MIDNIEQLIKEANNAQYHPTQRIFDSTARDFVHHSPSKSKTKPRNTVSGRYKRHLERKARGVKHGFDSAIRDEKVTFRVEMKWCDVETEEESNEQLHWIECKKFKGEQYKFYKKYFNRAKDGWGKGETVESEFVCRYLGNWLILNRDKKHLNEAFVFPSTNKRDEVIRDLIYHVLWTGEYPNYVMDEDLAIVLKNIIRHEVDGKIN